MEDMWNADIWKLKINIIIRIIIRTIIRQFIPHRFAEAAMAHLVDNSEKLTFLVCL